MKKVAQVVGIIIIALGIIAGIALILKKLYDSRECIEDECESNELEDAETETEEENCCCAEEAKPSTEAE